MPCATRKASSEPKSSSTSASIKSRIDVAPAEVYRLPSLT